MLWHVQFRIAGKRNSAHVPDAVFAKITKNHGIFPRADLVHVCIPVVRKTVDRVRLVGRQTCRPERPSVLVFDLPQKIERLVVHHKF